MEGVGTLPDATEAGKEMQSSKGSEDACDAGMCNAMYAVDSRQKEGKS